MKEGSSYSRMARPVAAGKLQASNRQSVSLGPIELLQYDLEHVGVRRCHMETFHSVYAMPEF